MDGYFEYKGRRIHFTEQGRGVPVVLVHGYLETSEILAGFAKILSGNHRVLSIDLPGHGLSDSYDEVYSMEFMAGSVASLLDHLHIEKAFVAGHSLGGRLALEYTLAHPERVEALILLAPAGLSDSFYPLDRWALGRDSIVRAGTRLTTERLYMRFYRKRVVRDPRYAYPDVAAWAVAGLLTPEGRSALREVTRHALAAPDLTDRLDEIEVPVLLVWGKDDEVLRFESSAAYRELLPDLRGFLALEDCGHHPQTERSARTARAAYEFLAGLRAAGTSPP